MIGEAGYETSEESSDFKDVREMRADKTRPGCLRDSATTAPMSSSERSCRLPAPPRASAPRSTGSPTPGEPLLCPLRGRAGDTLLRAKRRREDDIRLPQPDSRSLTRREGRRRPLRVKS